MRLFLQMVKHRIKGKVFSLWSFVLQTCFYIFRIFPVNPQKIIFSSYVGKGYGDNPKAIAEALHNRNPCMKFIWIYKGNDFRAFPSWIKVVNLYSLQMAYEMVTSKFWIDNARKPIFIRKRKNQFYIQTWHGSIALKKIEADIENYPIKATKVSIHDSQMIDVMISNGKWCTDMFKRIFWYTGPIKEFGSPRCDLFFNNNKKRDNINKYFNITNDVKIALYAPTFRDSKKDIYSLDLRNLKSALSKKFGKPYIIIVRLHPKMKIGDVSFKFNREILDGTDFPDMYELLHISDCLVTDYSSTMFEASYTYKPVWLFATDIYNYVSERGFYFSFQELPFSLSQNNTELIKNIESFNLKEYKQKVSHFHKKLGLVEQGNASVSVAKLIEAR